MPETEGKARKVMEPIEISNQDARDFLIRYQQLNQRQEATAANILRYVRKAGCIQYDPLDVVGRNPDLVLQARFSGFHRRLLTDMLYGQRALIDSFDKERAIIAAADWPAFRRIRQRNEGMFRRRMQRWGQGEGLEHLDMIKAEVAGRGPLFSRDVPLPGCDSGRWGHKRLSGAAMEYLLESGVFGVHHKKNTLRAYDLIENLLPAALLQAPDPFADDDAFLLWYVKRRIGSVGLLWARQGGGWNGHYVQDNALRNRALTRLLETGEIMAVAVDGVKETLYVRAEDAPLLNRPVSYDNSVCVLAPLDNAIWDRGLTEKLFRFRYSWEVYLPAAKRKYGYYVLPVLYRDQIVARFEPLQHRGADDLRFGKWWWEDGTEVTPDLLTAAERGLAEFAAYLGAKGIDPACLALLRRTKP
jgi:uncharacterized protein YcaQ